MPGFHIHTVTNFPCTSTVDNNVWYCVVLNRVAREFCEGVKDVTDSRLREVMYIIYESVLTVIVLRLCQSNAIIIVMKCSYIFEC